jgi:integrase
MSDRLYAMLQKRLKVVSISGKLFDVTVAALKDAFDRAVNKAGLEDLHFHDLRHTFATRLVQAGEDLYKVQRLLGHKSIKMTERYAHHSPESLKSAAAALDNYYRFTTAAPDRQ